MSNNWNRHSHELKRELVDLIPHATLRELHQRQPLRHFLLLARQLLLLTAASLGAALSTNPLLWVPCALVSGFTLFNFTVLLHEVVHDAVTQRQRPWLKRLLGYLYAFPSGISAAQFSRWHLDHHAELGTRDGDPKRHHLSPRRNSRWLKLAYFTPALFFIYFRAARRETASYPPALRRRIARERSLTILGHLLLAIGIGVGFGAGVLVRAYLVPYLLVFPLAFALNRLGQHYAIDPTDPAKWSTLVKGHWFWDRAFLFSNYHLEHHYFPNVPCYKLPRLQRLLWPYYQRIGLHAHGYAWLFREYVVNNRPPHTNWEGDREVLAAAASVRG